MVGTEAECATWPLDSSSAAQQEAECATWGLGFKLSSHRTTQLYPGQSLPIHCNSNSM